MNVAQPVYVTGVSNNGYRTIKYNSTGVVQWNVAYSSGSGDQSNGIAVDVSGNVYVTGHSYTGTPAKSVYRTIKYNSSGVVQWNLAYDPGNNVAAHAIALDASGNVYVTGETDTGSTTYNFNTIKYDSSGVFQWNVKYDSGSDDHAQGIAVGVSGNVYVTGYSTGVGNQNFRTIKY